MLKAFVMLQSWKCPYTTSLPSPPLPFHVCFTKCSQSPLTCRKLPVVASAFLRLTHPSWLGGVGGSKTPTSCWVPTNRGLNAMGENCVAYLLLCEIGGRGPIWDSDLLIQDHLNHASYKQLLNRIEFIWHFDIFFLFFFKGLEVRFIPRRTESLNPKGPSFCHLRKLSFLRVFSRSSSMRRGY